MLNSNSVTAADSALPASELNVLQGSVVNLSKSSDAPIESQAKSDQCEPNDHANVCANSDIDVEYNKSGICSSENSLNDLLHPPDAVLLNYSDAELYINCALEAEQKNDAISEAQLACCDLLHNSDNTVELA